MFKLDDEAEKRIDFICQMDLIGRSIADAVMHHATAPMLRRSRLTKRIPAVKLRELLRGPHVRNGNLPALFAELTKMHGPVFELRPPFAKPMLSWPGRRSTTGQTGTDAGTSGPGTTFLTSRRCMARPESCRHWMEPTTAVYAMASQPGFYARIRSEADALFGNSDPDGKEFTRSAVGVTQPISTATCRRAMSTAVPGMRLMGWVHTGASAE